jgi:hypothetical protein
VPNRDPHTSGRGTCTLFSADHFPLRALPEHVARVRAGPLTGMTVFRHNFVIGDSDRIW